MAKYASTQAAILGLQKALKTIPSNWYDEVMEACGLCRIDSLDDEELLETAGEIPLERLRTMRVKAMARGMQAGNQQAVKAFNDFEVNVMALKETEGLRINIVPCDIPDIRPKWMTEAAI